MLGKSNPCDNNSRNPLQLQHQSITISQLDDEGELMISKIITSDLSEAITLTMI